LGAAHAASRRAPCTGVPCGIVAGDAGGARITVSAEQAPEETGKAGLRGGVVAHRAARALVGSADASETASGADHTAGGLEEVAVVACQTVGGLVDAERAACSARSTHVHYCDEPDSADLAAIGCTADETIVRARVTVIIVEEVLSVAHRARTARSAERASRRTVQARP
jgi:hypothetical protein